MIARDAPPPRATILNLCLDGGAAVLAHRTRSTTAYRRRILEALLIGSMTTRVGDVKKSEGDFQVPSQQFLGS